MGMAVGSEGRGEGGEVSFVSAKVVGRGPYWERQDWKSFMSYLLSLFFDTLWITYG